jgi:hypothetical protein
MDFVLQLFYIDLTAEKRCVSIESLRDDWEKDKTIVYRLWNLNFIIIYSRNVLLLSFKFQLWTPKTHFDLLYEISWLANIQQAKVRVVGRTVFSQSVEELIMS